MEDGKNIVGKHYQLSWVEKIGGQVTDMEHFLYHVVKQSNIGRWHYFPVQQLEQGRVWRLAERYSGLGSSPSRFYIFCKINNDVKNYNWKAA